VSDDVRRIGSNGSAVPAVHHPAREGAVSQGAVVPKGPSSPAELEAAIAARRDHLAQTVDELVQRAQPAALARSSVRGVGRGLTGATHTPDGELRAERIAAVLGAVLAVVVAVLVVRSRRRR